MKRFTLKVLSAVPSILEFSVAVNSLASAAEAPLAIRIVRQVANSKVMVVFMALFFCGQPCSFWIIEGGTRKLNQNIFGIFDRRCC